MFTFSLSTFIKISLLSTGERIAEIQKKLDDADGYDFYNSMTKAIRAKANAESQATLDRILASPSRDIERTYNTAAFNSFETKFGSKRSLERLSTKAHLFAPDRSFRITVDPLFRIMEKNVATAFCVWPSKSPALTQRYGAVACYIMRQALQSSAMANSQFGFFDATSNKKYSERQVSNNTNLIFRADCGSISALLHSL